MIKINLLNASLDKVESDETIKHGFLGQLKAILSSLGSGSGNNNFDDLSESSSNINPVLFLLKLIIMCSGVIILYYYEQETIPKLQKKLAVHTKIFEDAKAYNGKAAGAVAEIKKMKANKNSIEKQIESIGGLSRVRLKSVKVLDIVQQNLPEKMWFSSVKKVGANLALEGVAYSELEISTFIDILGKNVHFNDVSLVSSEDDVSTDQSGKKLKKFKINCNLEK